MMNIKTKIFGEIEIDNDRIIKFENGIVGFPELTDFVLLHDEERGVEAGICYLQSLQEPNFAMPVMDPLRLLPEYNPDVEEELLNCLGTITEDNVLVVVTVTVPKDLQKMSINLQAPIIINADERKAVQIIVEGEKYPVKYPIYDLLQK